MKNESLTSSHVISRELSDTLLLLCTQILDLPWRSTSTGTPLLALEHSLQHLKSLYTQAQQTELNPPPKLISGLKPWLATLTQRGPYPRSKRRQAKLWRLEIAEITDQLDETIKTISQAPMMEYVHPKYELSVAQAYLSRKDWRSTPDEILGLWKRLSLVLTMTPEVSHERHTALGYLTLLTLSLGRRAFMNAHVLLTLWKRLIDEELNSGTYGIVTLTTPQGGDFEAPLTTTAALHARDQLHQWRIHVHHLTELVRGLEREELNRDTAHYRYYRALNALQELDEPHLARAYELRLGETWIALFVHRGQAPIKASVGAFAGEAIIELLSLGWRFFRRWYFFYRLRGQHLKGAIEGTLQEVERIFDQQAP